ncbi:MAG: hypothetical protein MUP81_06935 [Dehalococcoidia bacterium]|nr:hypothetical protein [Dehalococcoidia bacterium]
MFSELMDNTSKGKHVYHKVTICEKHREIYDILITELATTRPDVIEKIVPYLEQAFIMGVKLNKKLVEVRLSEDFTAPANDMAKAEELRKERIRLVDMLDDNNQILKEYGDKPK